MNTEWRGESRQKESNFPGWRGQLPPRPYQLWKTLMESCLSLLLRKAPSLRRCLCSGGGFYCPCLTWSVLYPCFRGCCWLHAISHEIITGSEDLGDSGCHPWPRHSAGCCTWRGTSLIGNRPSGLHSMVSLLWYYKYICNFQNTLLHAIFICSDTNSVFYPFHLPLRKSIHIFPQTVQQVIC